MAVIFILSVVFFIGTLTAQPSRFLDLRNIAAYFIAGIGLVSGAIAYITGKIGWKSKKS